MVLCGERESWAFTIDVTRIENVFRNPQYWLWHHQHFFSYGKIVLLLLTLRAPRVTVVVWSNIVWGRNQLLDTRFIR